MANYAKSAAGALKSIRKAGMAGVIRRVVAGEYDTDTSKMSAPVTKNYPCFAAKFDYELQSAGASQADGTLILTGDKQIFIPAAGLAVVPANGDLVILNGETWVIKNVKAVQPAAIAILYEVQGRK